MTISVFNMKRGTEGEKHGTLVQQLTVPDGESYAVINLPAGRSITVDVEPGAGATSTVYHTLEADVTTIQAGTAPPGSTWLREWPSGGVTTATTDVFHVSASAIVCYSTGGTTTFRVRM